MINIDLTNSVTLSLTVEKDKTLNKTFKAEIYDGETFVGYFDFSEYTGATLQVKKNPKAFSALSFSTADGSIVFGSFGEFTLSKAASEMFLSSGQYVYEMDLHSSMETRGFMRGKFCVIDEAYGEIEQDINKSEPIRINVKAQYVITPVPTGGTGTTNYNFSNGLTKTRLNVKWGGSLTGNTAITGNGSSLELGQNNNRLFNFRTWANGSVSMDGNNSALLQSSGSSVQVSPTNATFIAANTGSILFDSTGLVVVDNHVSKRGLEYDADYSAGFTNRSLVDKEYVQNAISNLTGSTGSTNVTASNGLTKSGDDIKLGGALDQNTVVDGNGNRNISFQNNYDFVVDHSYGSFKMLGDGGYELQSKPGSNGVRLIGDDTINDRGEVNVNADIATIGVREGGLNTYKHRLEFDGTNAKFTDSRTIKTGIEYDADYSESFTDRSLVDKQYVDLLVSGATGATEVTAGNGLSIGVEGRVELGGTGGTASVSMNGGFFMLSNVNPAGTGLLLGSSDNDDYGSFLYMHQVGAEQPGYKTAIRLSPAVAKFIDNRDTTVGLEYQDDYSSDFTNRSLVDKEYVDVAIAAATSGSTTGPLFKSVGSSYTIQAADNGYIIEVTGSTNCTITVPSGITVQFTVNNLMAANTVTFAAGGGATLQLSGTVLSSQFDGASLYTRNNFIRGWGNLN